MCAATTGEKTAALEDSMYGALARVGMTISASPVNNGEREPLIADCKPAHVAALRQLLSMYKAKQRMRKSDRDLLKMIHSYRQGFDGDNCRCVYPSCSITDPIGKLELHHYDETESHNEVLNTGPIHHNCNSSMNGRKREDIKRQLLEGSRLLDVRERDHTTPTDEKEYTSREGEKHDLMRVRWNAWIHDAINGPFRGQHSKIRITALSKMAVHALGMGSSVTYRRYIEEDYYGSIFDYEVDDAGYKFIVYLGPKKERTNPV